ncbi:MAG: hypothetical protein JWP63_4278 [Candidatus Solibacter sp.]|nr:hypothetical protein [Candidatus Solibacter sp.]
MRNLLLIGICACGLGSAADAPYAGKWKMNAAKTNFGESTVTYEQLPGGEMKATADGQSFTFKTDGKDVMTPWGITQAWKPIDSRSWEITEKTNGKVTATSTLAISADDKMLTLDSKRVKADGGTSDDSMSFQRVSGGPGLVGKWKTKKMTSSSPETLILTLKGSDGVAIELGNEGAVCNAKFDGKDYPATGSMWPSGWTCMIAKHGASALDVTWKKDGKGMYQSTLTASGNGKVLTETGSAVGVNEKYTVVYDKQ